MTVKPLVLDTRKRDHNIYFASIFGSPNFLVYQGCMGGWSTKGFADSIIKENQAVAFFRIKIPVFVANWFFLKLVRPAIPEHILPGLKVRRFYRKDIPQHLQIRFRNTNPWLWVSVDPSIVSVNDLHILMMLCRHPQEHGQQVLLMHHMHKMFPEWPINALFYISSAFGVSDLSITCFTHYSNPTPKFLKELEQYSIKARWESIPKTVPYREAYIKDIEMSYIFSIPRNNPFAWSAKPETSLLINNDESQNEKILRLQRNNFSILIFNRKEPVFRKICEFFKTPYETVSE